MRGGGGGGGWIGREEKENEWDGIPELSGDNKHFSDCVVRSGHRRITRRCNRVHYLPLSVNGLYTVTTSLGRERERGGGEREA